MLFAAVPDTTWRTCAAVIESTAAHYTEWELKSEMNNNM